MIDDPKLINTNLAKQTQHDLRALMVKRGTYDVAYEPLILSAALATEKIAQMKRRDNREFDESDTKLLNTFMSQLRSLQKQIDDVKPIEPPPTTDKREIRDGRPTFN